MKKIYLLLLLCFASLSLQAQENCPHYKRLMGEAEKFIQQDSLQQALDKYNSALTHCPQKQEEVKAKIDTLFVLIDGLRKEAEAKETEALKMQAKMQRAVFDKAVQDKFPEWQGYEVNFEKKEEILRQIDSLDLSDNALISLPRELLDCPNLQHLNLLGNEKMIWDSLAIISVLPKLQSIYVSVNDLSDIEEAYWKKITGIEILKDGLEAIPENILAQKQLTYLDLKNCNIRSLPATLQNLSNLEYLDCSVNPLDQLPEIIGNLSNLQSLDLGATELNTLPESFGKLVQLRNLNLASNVFMVFPEIIIKLNQLQKLDLSNNYFDDLPKEIGKLSQLQQLNLGHVSLDTLPKEIEKLSNLELLVGVKLSHVCQAFKDFPKPIGISFTTNLHNWKVETSVNGLNIGVYPEKKLPPEIGQLKNLQELNLTNLAVLDATSSSSLREEGLKVLPPEIGQLSNLQKLELWGNSIRFLPSEIGSLINLQELNLDENNLTSLPKEIGQLESLQELSISNTQVSFSSMRGDNYLTTLPKEISKLQQLRVLDLSNNPFSEEEQKRSKNLLPNCKISFGEFNGDLIPEIYLYSYFKQGILAEKVDKFKELNSLYLGRYELKIEEQQEIQALLPHCEITFKELSANDYNRAVIEEYNKGNYKIAYEYQQKACELDSTNANSFFNLAYFALYNNDYQVAISAAQKTLEIDSSRVSVETNLALGYLLNNQWEEAEKIYTKWKGKKFPDTGDGCNAVFLQDITDLEKAGVKHQDFEKVRELLE